MKRLTYLTVSLAILCITVTGCRRERKVNYARVPVDTTAHNDVPTADDEWDHDEAVIALPDIPKESDLGKSNAKDVERMMRGEY